MEQRIERIERKLDNLENEVKEMKEDIENGFNSIVTELKTINNTLQGCLM